MENYDSRDLEEELQELLQCKEDGEDYDKDRLKELEDLKEETESYGWEYGIYFIHEQNFRDYAEELFDDCYAHDIPDNLKTYIDYEAFASDLEQDYSEVEFEGEIYLYREA
jgi:antirestriction protein